MNAQDQLRSIPERVAALLAQMTITEKIAQLGSCWMYEIQTDGVLDAPKIAARLSNGIGQVTRPAGASIFSPPETAKAVNQLQSFLIHNTRLGIPAIMHEECCSGNMILGGSMFPQIIGLASTFRPELAEKMTDEIRRQLRAIGIHQGLAPVLDVARDPRWGRVEESFGEDPLLISQFGVHYIRGLQGDDPRSGVMATGKHFIAHSLSQGGLNCAPVQLGPNTLWNVYLMPFQAAIRQANIAAVMNSYPELDGEVVAASARILTDLLRRQLGFEGLLVSDYEAIQMIHNYHHVAPDQAAAAAAGFNAGIEVELPTIQCYTEENLTAAIHSGQIRMEQIDAAVGRHLQKKFELGLFENPYVDEGNVIECFETPAQRALALEIARQSIVLLGNDGTLPLKKDIATLAVIGPNADNARSLLGDYSYAAVNELLCHQQPPESIFCHLDRDTLQSHQVKVPTILEVLRARLPHSNVQYARGCDVRSDDRSGLAEAQRIAAAADAVVLVLGDKSGLTPDCTCGETRDSADLRLPGAQNELVAAVIAAGKPVVAVLINGRPLAIPELAGSAAAILEAWLPGEEGAAAIADVLFGDANPGGKLPMTFPRSAGQVPVFYNDKPSGRHSHWYHNYVSESVQPLFPFGHGLSYTRFEYRDLHITPTQAGPGETVQVSFTLQNSGAVAGEEVVQLYCCDPCASSPRPLKELKAFARVALDPGAERRITFHLPVDILAFYNTALELVVEPGKILLMPGSSSADIRLHGEFEITGAGPHTIAERVFTCPVEIR